MTRTETDPGALASAHRWDIQVLRGWAVGLVWLQHVLPGLAGGYLGVDVFFAISGYLITGQILREQRAGRFSLREFYARRARRLLPAAYVVLAVTAVVVGVWLNAQELHDAARQHWGALGFVNNLVLWTQTGYFAGAAELKPLLHFWSLSLEEQFYLLLPALLLATGGGRRAGLTLALLCVASLGLAAAWQRVDASAAFYLLPTRAWELGLGALAAWWPTRAPALARGWRMALLVPVVLLPLVPLPSLRGWGHPGLNALLVVGATALLLRHPVNRAAPGPLRPLVGLGDVSYSLYLVHWPLIALVNNAWVGPAPAPELSLARGLAGLAALPLAWLLWRWVEQPTRRWPLPRSAAAWMTVAGVSLALAGLPALWRAPALQDARAPNHGLAASCDQWQRWQDRPECRSAPAPQWAVWGDSTAMHLAPGLVEVAPGLRQATQSSCGPLPGLVPWRAEARAGDSFTRGWARQCEGFNRSVLAGLLAADGPRVVLLSSLLEPYLDAPRGHLLRFDDRGEHELAPDRAEDAVVDAAADLARRLRAAGRRLVWVAPLPHADFDAGACQERRLAGRPRLGAPSDCRIERGATRELARRVAAVLARLESEAGIPVLHWEPLLCEARFCRTANPDGLLLYRDAVHLSIEGSRRLLPQLAPAARVEALAR